MFTDMVGFTAAMQEDEQSALALRDRYRTVIEDLHDRLGGEIVQYYGDGALSMFPNAVDAVTCAVAIQKELSQAPEVPVRVGLHVGDVVVEDHGLLGDAVNVASRIESFGMPGAVLVSDSIHDLVKNQHDLEFVSLGEFHLDNVARPFGIFAVDTDGLVVPDPSSLAGKGRPGPIERHTDALMQRVSVLASNNREPDSLEGSGRRVTERSEPSGGRSWRVAVAAAAVLAIVTGVGLTIRDTSSSDETSGSSVPTSMPVATTALSEDSPVVWEVKNGEPARLLAISGGVVVAGREDSGGFVLEGLAAATGEPLWQQHMGTVYSLQDHEDSVIVVHRVGLLDRADFLDPSTGEPISGCGFVLPTAGIRPGEDVFSRFVMQAQQDAGASITTDASYTYVLYGVSRPGDAAGNTTNGLIRMITDPTADSCHADPIFQGAVTRWPPVRSGPVSAGDSVYVGDSGTLNSYRVDDLNIEWDTFPANGQVAGYDGSVIRIAARDIEFQYADGVRTETMLYVVDGESTLHKVENGVLVNAVESIGGPAVVTEQGVIYVDPDGTLRGADHDLVETSWERGLGEPTIGPVLIDGLVIVVMGNQIRMFDPENGDEILSGDLPGTLVAMATGHGIVLASDETGTLTAIAIPGETIENPTSAREEPEPVDPVEVAHDFYAAIAAGDRSGVSKLVGIDLHIAEQYTADRETVPWSIHWWFNPDTRERFWTRIDLLTALNAKAVLGDCETAERRDGEGTEVVCDVTHTDEFHDVFGVEFSGKTHVVVRDGLVRMLFSGEFDSREYSSDASRRAGHYFHMKVGEYRGMDLGTDTGEWFERTWDWARDQHPGAFAASCTSDSPKTATADCALYLLDIAPEFASNQEP
jgi:hypothetical protein